MNNKKVDGYVFWLAEYLSRKVHQTSLPGEIEKAAQDAVDIFSQHYALATTGNALEDYEALLATDDYKKIWYYKAIYERKHLKGKIPEKTIEQTQVEVNYSINNYDEAIYEKCQAANSLMLEASSATLKSSWQPAHANDIIESVISGTIAPPDGGYDAILGRTMENIRPVGNDAGFAIQIVGDDRVSLPKMYVDISIDTELLANEFATLIDGIKHFHSSAGDKKESSHDLHYKHLLRFMQITDTICYEPKSDAARAVGLWLWDYVAANQCSVGAAVREIKKQDFLTPLQFSSSPDRVLERIYARTRECIEQGEVLSMS